MQTHLKSTYADTVTIPCHRSPSRPLMDYQAHNYSRGALCQSDGRQNGRRGCAFDNELKGCQHQKTQGSRVLQVPTQGND